MFIFRIVIVRRGHRDVSCKRSKAFDAPANSVRGVVFDLATTTSIYDTHW